jgi:multidrug efflux pump subunit AcrB
MRTVVSWTVNNMPAMNTLVMAVLLVGALAFGTMRREVFPECDLEIVLVTVPYPGATPEEVEEGIYQKIEEACRSVAEEELRDVTEEVRDDLLGLAAVSAANIQGAKDYEIDIEIPEATLREYGLSLRAVADIVRRENLELPGGTIRSEGGEILLRGKNKRSSGAGIAELPLVTLPDGLVLTVGDLATVRDESADVVSSNRINGRAGMVISVDRTSDENLLAMVAAVNSDVREG